MRRDNVNLCHLCSTRYQINFFIRFLFNFLDFGRFDAKFTLYCHMKTRILLISIASVVVCFFRSLGQDVVFSQFYANPLYLNPAFAGNADGPRLSFNFRNQWPSLNASFVTYSAGFDQYLPAIRGGVGILLLADQIGSSAYKQNQASLIYSNSLRISNSLYLKTGFQYTFISRSLNFSKLVFPEQLNPISGIGPRPPGSTLPTTENSITIHDFTAGAILFSENFFMGATFHHLAEPNQSFITDSKVPLPLRTSIYAGGNIPLSPSYGGETGWTLSPNIIYITQKPAKQINLGAFLSKGPGSVGLWYRVKDAIILSGGFRRGKMQFGYGYDITVSGLRLASPGGSHEVSLRFIFENPVMSDRYRYSSVKCPSF